MAVNLKVLDLSHHNCGPSGDPDDPIDFDAVRAFGVVGIIHKASQGVSVSDKKYAERRQAAARAGLLWGAYHFATGDDADAQVRWFLRCAQPDANTLVALDHEPNNGNELDAPGARAWLESCRDQVGRLPKFYSGSLIKQQNGALSGDDRSFFSGVSLWLCQYGPSAVLTDFNRRPLPWSSYWLWQFSGDGVASHGIMVPGVFSGSKVDMNTWDGSDEDLAGQWAS